MTALRAGEGTASAKVYYVRRETRRVLSAGWPGIRLAMKEAQHLPFAAAARISYY